MFEGFLGQVADVVLPALAEVDFALGGGNGLRLLGVTDRDSADIDTYYDKFDEHVYASAESLILAAVRDAGWNAEVWKTDSYFRRIQVWQPGADPSRSGIGIDVGQEYRSAAPTRLPGGGLVMALDDIAAGKCRVLIDQGRPWDYADAAALLMHPGWDYARLLAAAVSVKPHLSAVEFAAHLRRVDNIPDADFVRIGLNPVAVRAAIQDSLPR